MKFHFNMINKKDRYLGLPDFIKMTNTLEGRGFFINIIKKNNKYIGTITHKGKTQKTKKYFDKCIEAQNYTASEMFLLLKIAR